MRFFRKKQKQTPEPKPTYLIYLSPEQLKNSYIMTPQEFQRFQNSEAFVEGGKLFEISKQFGYQVRKVADLQEESINAINSSIAMRAQAGPSRRRPAMNRESMHREAMLPLEQELDLA